MRLDLAYLSYKKQNILQDRMQARFHISNLPPELQCRRHCDVTCFNIFSHKCSLRPKIKLEKCFQVELLLAFIGCVILLIDSSGAKDACRIHEEAYTLISMRCRHPCVFPTLATALLILILDYLVF